MNRVKEVLFKHRTIIEVNVKDLLVAIEKNNECQIFTNKDNNSLFNKCKTFTPK